MSARGVGVVGLARAALACAASAACGDPPLAPASDVRGPRVIAIVAEPPEALPGGSVAVRVVAGGFAAPRAPARWTVCARPEESSAGIPISSFGQFEPDRGCASEGAAGVTDAGTGDAVAFAVPGDALAREAWLVGAFGAGLSPATRRRLADEVGLPLVFTAEIAHAGGVVRAFKRVRVIARGAPNRNPPAPRFAFGGRRVERSAGGPDACAAVDGAEIVAAPGAQVRLVPDGDESWVETFTTRDPEGVVTEVREQAFYNVFATGGAWAVGRARMPDREPVWTAPASPGRVAHWFVVRDGRGGTAVCAFAVDVR